MCKIVETSIDLELERAFDIEIRGVRGVIEIWASDQQEGKLFIEFSENIKALPYSINEIIKEIHSNTLKQIYVLLTQGHQYSWYSKIFLSILELRDYNFEISLSYFIEKLENMFSDGGESSDWIWAKALWEYIENQRNNLFPIVKT
jgi:hypothetical protein